MVHSAMLYALLLSKRSDQAKSYQVIASYVYGEIYDFAFSLIQLCQFLSTTYIR